MNPGCYISILSDMTEPVTYRLEDFGKDVIYFGRGAAHGNSGMQNDLPMPQELSVVSRAHCIFYKADGRWAIRDEGSLNGLVINGARIDTEWIRDGDQYYIGSAQSNSKCMLMFTVVEDSYTPSAGSLSGTYIPVWDKYSCVIGRDADCDIVLSHPSVSRHHCIIVQENGAYYIYDNGSLNGVILNGHALTGKQPLNEMDKITIAGTTMVFSNGSLCIMESSRGVGVSVQNLVKAVPSGDGEKIIANNISLNIEPGEFVAIIGGSGAGKTTLLNCISSMTDFTSGDVIINGDSILTSSKSLRSIMGYVPQNDIVHDNLTLERMLMYSAKLRMPDDTTREEIEQKIDEVLDMVELTAHRGTFIKRLSGGQRKRASIAVELLASPKLFFLDEPSSGLDPSTEKHLMYMLKRLAESGKTVIMVTHTTQNVGICDRLICMGNGGLLCFSGSPSEADRFFGKSQFTDIYDDLNERSWEVAERFYQYQNGKAKQNSGMETCVREPEQKNSLFHSLKQFAVMSARYVEIMFNSRFKFAFLLLMPVLLTAIVCVVFQADGNLFNYLDMSVERGSMPFVVGSDTMKLMFSFSCAGFWVGIFNSVQEISKERLIYNREQFAGVRATPYVMSKYVVLSVLCAVQSLLMLGLFMVLTDTTATVDGDIHSVSALDLKMKSTGVVLGKGMMGMELFITLFLSMLGAMALGLVISSAVSNEMSMVICPICLLPQILFSGVVSDLRGFTETISKFIICRWSCIAFFTSVDVNSMYFSCEYGNDGTWQKVPYPTGIFSSDYAADTEYLFGMDPVSSAWAAFIIMILVCVAAAILFMSLSGVRFRKRK